MAVEQFTDGIEPDDPNAAIWRFMELWKFRDLLATGQLFFRRSDKLEDVDEGVPSEEFARQALGLNAYDINDIQKLNHDLGSTAQFRQAFYINCWYLFDQETAAMWAKYGRSGVAIVSRYSLLKAVLDPLTDRPHLGLVRYGWQLGTRWNLLRFITTKQKRYEHEREVRALLWILDSGDSINRHVDIDNRVHSRPIYDPPPTLPEGVKRPINLATLITEVVVTPNAATGMLEEVEGLVRAARLGAPVNASNLTEYARFLPTAEELHRFSGQ
jgi:hypothetical protein